MADDDKIDLTQFAIPPDELEQILKTRRNKSSSPQTLKLRKLFGPGVRFVKGPLPASLLGQTYRLHHAAPLVLMAIQSEVDIQNWRKVDDPEVAVTTALCAEFGVGRDARLRAIHALEAAGLITVIWADRRAPRVRLAPGLFEEGKITVRTP